MQKMDITIETVKIAPAAPVTSFLGYSIADWASMVTLIYVFALLSYFIWKRFVRPWQRWHRKRYDPLKKP